jgi:hypothetical protein
MNRLKNLNIWVPYALEKKEGRKKLIKVPKNPNAKRASGEHYNARAGDFKTCGSYSQVDALVNLIADSPFAGMGLQLFPFTSSYNERTYYTDAQGERKSKDNFREMTRSEKTMFSRACTDFEGYNLVVIDLDGCIQNGEVAPWALNILSMIHEPWVDVSPSKTGLHILVYGNGSQYQYCRFGPIELYSHSRFLTMPFTPLPGYETDTIPVDPEGVEAVYNMWIKEPTEKHQKEHNTSASTSRNTNGVYTSYIGCTDDQIIARMLLSPWLKQLWDGDYSEYRVPDIFSNAGDPDPSGGTLGLLTAIAKRTNKDIVAMERIFKRSKFYQLPEIKGKWEDPGRAKYRARTLERACRFLTDPEREIQETA